MKKTWQTPFTFWRILRYPSKSTMIFTPVQFEFIPVFLAVNFSESIAKSLLSTKRFTAFKIVRHDEHLLRRNRTLLFSGLFPLSTPRVVSICLHIPSLISCIAKDSVGTIHTLWSTFSFFFHFLRKLIHQYLKTFGSNLHHFLAVRLSQVRLFDQITVGKRPIVVRYCFLLDNCFSSKLSEPRIKIGKCRLTHRDFLSWRVKCRKRFHIHAVENSQQLSAQCNKRMWRHSSSNVLSACEVSRKCVVCTGNVRKWKSPAGTVQLSTLFFNAKALISFTKTSLPSNF